MSSAAGLLCVVLTVRAVEASRRYMRRPKPEQFTVGADSHGMLPSAPPPLYGVTGNGHKRQVQPGCSGPNSHPRQHRTDGGCNSGADDRAHSLHAWSVGLPHTVGVTCDCAKGTCQQQFGTIIKGRSEFVEVSGREASLGLLQFTGNVLTSPHCYSGFTPDCSNTVITVSTRNSDLSVFQQVTGLHVQTLSPCMQNLLS